MAIQHFDKTQLLVLGKLRYTWCPNFKVVLLMILVCQVHYYNIGSTLHKYECREMDIWLDICDICFYKKGALKSSKILQLAWNFFWLDKIKIYCHLSFFNFSVRQVWNWYLLRYLPYLYLQGGCCKIVQNNQICVQLFLLPTLTVICWLWPTTPYTLSMFARGWHSILKVQQKRGKESVLVNVLFCKPSGAVPRCGLKVSRCSCCQREIERSNT